MKNIKPISLENLNELGLVDNLINLYANIPNRNTTNGLITELLQGMNISDKNILEIKSKLDNIGVSTLNKDGLNEFIAQKLVSNFNVSDSISMEIVSLSNKIISSYLVRIIRDKNTNELQILNESQEALLLIELEKLKKELKKRVGIKNKKLKAFENKLTEQSDLTVSEFLEASNLWLENSISEKEKLKIKNDVGDFLNGDNNIIIEL